MMGVHWHSAALAEAERAHDYYLESNPLAAEQFRVELDRAVAQIVASPERWRLFADGTRRCRFRHFPYSIVYYVRAERIDVIAVAHHRRRPGYWSARE